MFKKVRKEKFPCRWCHGNTDKSENKDTWSLSAVFLWPVSESQSKQWVKNAELPNGT